MENEQLVLDLLEWIGTTSKPYEEVMNAWRTSCPRLTIWEDTIDAGYLAVCNRKVHVTTEGLKFLRTRRNQAFAV
jgi:hypothetical protein